LIAVKNVINIIILLMKTEHLHENDSYAHGKIEKGIFEVVT
jgi:hypothetical protein